jgi:hypothetical protein
MKTIPKVFFDRLVKMINDGDKISWIKAYCEGFGLNTSDASSPVYITNIKICITYRRVNHYYFF